MAIWKRVASSKGDIANMGIRKNALRMTATERDEFLAAVLTLKNTIANPADPLGQQISVYDQFVAMHTGVLP